MKTYSYSRGQVKGNLPQHQPLSPREKGQIEALTAVGCSSRQIADWLGVGEGQVSHYRERNGIRARHCQNKGWPNASSGFRPAHSVGKVGSREWFASNDAAFQAAMRTELEGRRQIS